MHAFWTNYHLWRAINVVVDSRIIKFPLPPCSRIVPIQCSWWNSTKGPSDTTTKLLDNCEEQLGIRNPQTIATARLLAIGGVVFHRCNQILGGKDCLFYQSIDSYRGAANERAPFWKSLVSLCEFFGGEATYLEEQQKPPRPLQHNTTPLTPKPRTRKAVIEQSAHWMMEKKTDFTPKVGRKNKSQPHKAAAHSMRQKKCRGVVLVSRVGTRGLCKLCRQKTSYFCTGCKNAYCFQTGGDCGEKIKQMRKLKTIPSTAMPARFLILSSKGKDGTTTTMKVRNSCFHIAHSTQYEKFFEEKEQQNGDENKTPDKRIGN